MREAHMLYAILGPELTSDFVRTVENGDPKHTENLREIAKKLSDLNVRKKPPVMLIAMASAMWALSNVSTRHKWVLGKDSDRFPALSSADAQDFTFKYLGDEVVNALRRFGIERPESGDEHITWFDGFDKDKTTYNNWVSDSVESIWDDFGWF